jgi:hypothetical protein
MQINTIQYNTIQYSTIQYNTIKYNTIQYNTIQYNTIQYNTIQYNTIQHNRAQYFFFHYFSPLTFSNFPPLPPLLSSLFSSPSSPPLLPPLLSLSSPHSPSFLSSSPSSPLLPLLLSLFSLLSSLPFLPLLSSLLLLVECQRDVQVSRCRHRVSGDRGRGKLRCSASFPRTSMRCHSCENTPHRYVCCTYVFLHFIFLILFLYLNHSLVTLHFVSCRTNIFAPSIFIFYSCSLHSFDFFQFFFSS